MVVRVGVRVGVGAGLGFLRRAHVLRKYSRARTRMVCEMCMSPMK